MLVTLHRPACPIKLQHDDLFIATAMITFIIIIISHFCMQCYILSSIKKKLSPAKVTEIPLPYLNFSESLIILTTLNKAASTCNINFCLPRQVYQ